VQTCPSCSHDQAASPWMDVPDASSHVAGPIRAASRPSHVSSIGGVSWSVRVNRRCSHGVLRGRGPRSSDRRSRGQARAASRTTLRGSAAGRLRTRSRVPATRPGSSKQPGTLAGGANQDGGHDQQQADRQEHHEEGTAAQRHRTPGRGNVIRQPGKVGGRRLCRDAAVGLLACERRNRERPGASPPAARRSCCRYRP
jgi:hypothetical protein